MKTQMKFQKIVCLAMLIAGALCIVMSFVWASGSWVELSYRIDSKGKSMFKTKKGSGLYDATLFNDIGGPNDILMYCGIVILVLAICLYITATNKRRNYYITNYVATGVVGGGTIVLSLVMMIVNGIWMGKFQNIDFAAWKAYDDGRVALGAESHYSESLTWFIIAFVVYILVILVAVALILNMLWKIKLMKGEKKLLEQSAATLANGTVATSDEALGSVVSDEEAAPEEDDDGEVSQ